MLKSFSKWLFKKTHQKEIQKILRVSKLIALKSKDTQENNHNDVSLAMKATLSTLNLWEI
jgi:hypothetical protein